MRAEEVIAGERRWSVECSDALAWLRGLPDECVQTCVTSPPYFGLRDYGTGTWEGGDVDCDHKQETPRFNGPKQTAAQVSGHASNAERNGRKVCRCGARRIDQQIGLEATPAEFVARLVEVFAEARRVLRKDGTCWVNMGDSYNAYNGGAGPSRSEHEGRRDEARPKLERGYGLQVKSLKPKEIIGIPWRLAFALQSDGWYLRQDIIWSKPNPMPESVRDRCTKAHEYIFLLAKSERYFFDQEAISEPFADERLGNPGNYTDRYSIGSGRNDGGRKNREWNVNGERTTRNKRSVWEVCPASFKGAHFATFPPKLITPCILAGSRTGDIVLDPFAGSGTTLAVAVERNRRAIGCELNPKYLRLIEGRMRSVTLCLEGVA